MFNCSENYNCLADLGAVYLLLGSACNMTCRHCSQTPIKNTLNLSPCGGNLSQDVIDFIVKWSNLPWKYSNQRRLYFWGGEPLLFWETIKKSILLFEELGILNISYRIFSNGLLLDDEIAEFCNEHNVWFIMSHDAPNPTAVRNACPSDSNCKSFMKIKKRTVNSVFCAVNNDMVATFKYLEDKFPNTEISCGFINVLSDIPKDIWDFKAGDVTNAIVNLYGYAISGDKWADMWFRSKIGRARFSLDEFCHYPFPPCRPALVSLSMNFNGDVFRCHNDSCVVAHISDSFAEIQQAHLSEWRSLLPTECLKCEHLDLCRCICPIALKTKDNKELVYCDYMKEFWGAIKSVCSPHFNGGDVIG